MADTTQGLSIVGVQQIDRIVEVVEETLKGDGDCGDDDGCCCC